MNPMQMVLLSLILFSTVCSPVQLTAAACELLHEHPGGVATQVPSQHCLKAVTADTCRYEIQLLSSLPVVFLNFNLPADVEINGCSMPDNYPDLNAKVTHPVLVVVQEVSVSDWLVISRGLTGNVLQFRERGA